MSGREGSGFPAFCRGSILEDAHGAGSAADLAEAAFDGVGGSHRLAFGEGLVAEAGQKLIEIVAQTSDGGRVTWPQRSAKRRAAERAFIAVSAFMTACRSALRDVSWAFLTLLRTLRTLCAQQRWTGILS